MQNAGRCNSRLSMSKALLHSNNHAHLVQLFAFNISNFPALLLPLSFKVAVNGIGTQKQRANFKSWIRFVSPNESRRSFVMNKMCRGGGTKEGGGNWCHVKISFFLIYFVYKFRPTYGQTLLQSHPISWQSKPSKFEQNPANKKRGKNKIPPIKAREFYSLNTFIYFFQYNSRQNRIQTQIDFIFDPFPFFVQMKENGMGKTRASANKTKWWVQACIKDVAQNECDWGRHFARNAGEKMANEAV